MMLMYRPFESLVNVIIASSGDICHTHYHVSFLFSSLLFVDVKSLFFICTDAAAKHVGWDASKVRNKLKEHIQDHVESIRNAKLAELKSNYEVTFLDFSKFNPFGNILYL